MKITLVDKISSLIKRNTTFSSFQRELRFREKQAREFLNKNTNIQHLMYGYRYPTEEGVDCYIVLMPLTDKQLDEYIERSSKVNGVLYVLHQR